MLVQTEGNQIASKIAKIQRAVDLKKDDRRVSLEGILSGTALALVFMLLEKPAIGAMLGRRRGGAIPEPGKINLGEFTTDVGDMPYWDLSTIGLGPEVKSEIHGGSINAGSSTIQAKPTAIENSKSNSKNRTNVFSSPIQPTSRNFGGIKSENTDNQRTESRKENPVEESTTGVPKLNPKTDRVPDPDPEPKYSSKTDIARIDPPLVDVYSVTEVVARTKSDIYDANAHNSGKTIGINKSIFSNNRSEEINNRSKDGMVFRQSKTVADARSTNASVNQELFNYGVNESSGRTENNKGNFIASVVEVNEICIKSGEKAAVNTTNQASAFNDSTWTGGEDSDRLQFETLMVNRIEGLGKSKQGDIDLNLKAIGVNQSQLSTINLKNNLFKDKTIKESDSNETIDPRIIEYSIDDGITWIKPHKEDVEEIHQPQTIAKLGELFVSDDGEWELKPFLDWDQEPIKIHYRTNREEMDAMELIGVSGEDKLHVLTAMTGAPNTGISEYDNKTIKTILSGLVIPINNKAQLLDNDSLDNMISLKNIDMISRGKGKTDYISGISPKIFNNIKGNDVITFTTNGNGVYADKPYYVKNVDKTEKTFQIGGDLSSESIIDFTETKKINAIFAPTHSATLHNPKVAESGYGIDLQFGCVDSLEESSVDVKIKAENIGIKDSIITMGDGDDEVEISSFMMEYLDADLATLGQVLNNKSLVLNNYSLYDTHLLMGPGNDLATLRGNIGGLVGTIVDVGTGENKLYINGSISGNTTFVIGQGINALNISGIEVNEDLEGNHNEIRYKANDGSSLSVTRKEYYGTEDGEYFKNRLNHDDNTWEIMSLSEHKWIDGFSGEDQILSSGKDNRDEIRLIGRTSDGLIDKLNDNSLQIIEANEQNRTEAFLINKEEKNIDITSSQNEGDKIEETEKSLTNEEVFILNSKAYGRSTYERAYESEDGTYSKIQKWEENNNNDTDQELVESGKGLIFETEFKNFETIDVQFSDDIVFMKNLGGLSGKLMMGEGVDTLDYSTWGREAIIDFGSNQASGIGTGYATSSVKDAYEGQGVTSVGKKSSFSGVDVVIGTPYEDHLSLKWTPWIEDGNTSFEFKAGEGADTYQFYGLDAEEGSQWMDSNSVPTLRDVDLDEGDRFEGFLGHEGQSLINATLLPIAPLEMLREGVTEEKEPFLGISNNDESYQLHAFGLDGTNQSRLIANLPGLNLKNDNSEVQ